MKGENPESLDLSNKMQEKDFNNRHLSLNSNLSKNLKIFNLKGTIKAAAHQGKERRKLWEESKIIKTI
ncbi:hypothetical protein DSO57_1022715 [Entomophthora muscae]|uniref:Uncharacterized protein n=1 Tax=Entomophthora muscae TaxID=34485 RepID=A0ACC2RHT3_9FUNG|nr:hypothetical protein DSO57_1022715 [Entomophthora muscae]